MIALNSIVDIHSHILPGIDDGADTFEDSIGLIRELSDYGVADIITTPHYIDETYYISSKAHNEEILGELKQRLADEGIETRVYLGNEIFINDKMPELLELGVVSTMAGSKYVLVELPLNDEFSNYDEYLLELMRHGYKVILAHPERYAITQKDYSVIEELHKMGILMQCNLGSIDGRYGNGAKKLVKRMAKDRLIWTFSSDLHHRRGQKYMEDVMRKLSKYYTERELRKLLCENPRQILAD